MCKPKWIVIVKILLLSPLLFSMVGCSIGKKNILFTTKTSLGIDIDVKPSTFDVGYSRREGTVSPKFEGGVLPQMASFKSDVGLVNTTVGQSFATGNPAILLSKYLGTDAALQDSPDIPLDEIVDKNRDSWIDGDTDHAERYFFGTDTSFAIKVAFSSDAGGFPESFSLGYKRKELAYVPIMTTTSAGKAQVGLPPLIATADMENNISSVTNANLQYKQFFATGVAASFLASQPRIRNALGVKILNDASIKKVLETRDNFQTQSRLSKEIITAFNGLTDNGKRVNVFDKAIALGIIEESLKDRSEADKANTKKPALFSSRLVLYVNKNHPDGLEKLESLNAHMSTLSEI